MGACYNLAPRHKMADIHVRENAMIDLEKNFNTTENPNIPELLPGDQVSVHVRIKEGDRERIQEFKGTVIRLRKGGNNANFTVRRTASNGIGVERTFLLHSPRIDKVVVERHTHVRRAQLYFLRGLTGKKSHLKQKFE
jgi:large subunit ribosomal protein L19